MAESQFPASLGKVASRQLTQHGITTYEQLTALSAKDLLAIHARGLSFHED